MKKIIVFFLLVSFCGFSQDENSIIKLIGQHNNASFKERDSLIKKTIDEYLLRDFINLKIDTIKMSYGLYFDRTGKLFISSNRIDNIKIYQKFESTFNGEKYIMPFKNSLNTITHKYLNNHLKYKKTDSLFMPIYDKLDMVKNNNSFAIIEQVPIFNGCYGNNKSLKKCMNLKIKKHIAKKFNIDLAYELDLKVGIKRIFVQFLINKKGFVSNIYARGPHVRLEKEAVRVINLLPQMIPGKQKDEAVSVRYNLPIVFRIDEDAHKEKQNEEKRK